MSDVQHLVDYWKNVFLHKNSNEILAKEYSVIPDESMGLFEREFAPQPYYGYFHEDMSNDILALLINPGEVSEDELNKLAIGRNREEKVDNWNAQIINRYLHWGKEEYIKQEKEIIESGIKWRQQRRNQALKIAAFDFFHTIEFFPYHSKNWEIDIEGQKQWLFELETTNLAVNAVLEIAREKKVKHIIGLQNPWRDILKYKEIPLIQEVIVKKHESNRYSFKFSKFQPTPDSLPIVIYNSGAGYINFPVATIAVQIMKILLGVSEEPIPTEHKEYQILIQE